METITALAVPSAVVVSSNGSRSMRCAAQRVSCSFGNVMVSGGARCVPRRAFRRRVEAESRFERSALQRTSLKVATRASSQDNVGSELKVEETKVEEATQELEKQVEETKAAYSDAVDALKEETLKVQESLKATYEPSAEKAIEVLKDTTEKLKKEAENARAILTATALETAELGKSNLNLLAENAPEPIKEVAETARDAHLSEKGKKGARIHDFCLGIPYGGILVAGGIISFLVTGSTAAIRFGVILGGALLFLSVTSLKVWKQEKSSIPYIQGQAALAAIIFIKDARNFLQTGAFFPSAVSALASGAMLAFYAYVYLAGGNPPKKVKEGEAA